jgi:oligopeptide transport system substrate-binding protein
MSRSVKSRAFLYGLVALSLVASACAGGGSGTAPASTSAPAASTAPTTAAAVAAPTTAGAGAAPTAAGAAAQPTAAGAAPTSAEAAPTSAESAPTAAAAAATTAPVAGGPQEIRIATTEPPSIDPGIAEDNVSIGLIMHLFEALVRQTPDGVIEPAVAEKWDVSPDGLTYTFHLRDGAKWSDGKPVTAGDFEWAWKRNIDPATASGYATSLFPVKNAEKIFNEKSLQPADLGVSAKDDRTLVVTLEKPAAYFLSLAATWTLMPLRQDTVEKNGDKWVEAANILSNGPYLMKEWTHDQQMVLEANPDYWGQKPSIQRAVFRIFPDGGEDQALSAYEAGELDSMGTNLLLPAAQVDRVKADPSLGYFAFVLSRTTWVTINNRNEILSDKNVRKAFGMAIEREVLIKDVLKAAHEPAFSLQPPGIMGRNPDLWPKEDLAAAKQLLADAGYPDGKGLPEMGYAYNTNTTHKLTSEYLQQRWKEALGVNIQISNMEWKVFLDWRSTEEWHQGGFFYRGGWGSDYEDPNNWYNILFDSNSDPGQFETGWKNDQYDTLVRQAAGELDAAKREQLYSDAEKILADEYHEIPLWHDKLQTVVRPWVKGFEPTRVLGVIPLESMTIEAH